MLRTAVLALAGMCLSGPALAGWGRDRVLERQEGNIPVAGIKGIYVDVEAGSLEIVGDPELAQVRYELEFVGEHGEDLQRLHFDHEVRGGELVIRTRTSSKGWRGRSGHINVWLFVPPNHPLRVDDSSGSMRVSRMNLDVSIDDSSGSIEVRDVGGNLRIDDSSGSIEVRGVGGSATIDDSSGGIDVSDVVGSLSVSDSSGGIDVRDIGGDFEVVRDGSGGIRHHNVRGRVDIPYKRR